MMEQSGGGGGPCRIAGAPAGIVAVTGAMISGRQRFWRGQRVEVRTGPSREPRR